MVVTKTFFANLIKHSDFIQFFVLLLVKKYYFFIAQSVVYVIMATSNNFAPNAPVLGSSGPNDLPPPYSAVVGNPQYGFVAPPGEPTPAGVYPQPKQFTATGVYPHPPNVANAQPQPGLMGPSPSGVPVPVGLVIPPAVGTEPTTVTCFNCGKVVTTRVTYTTAWHTHLVAGSICLMTMVCSLCCLGLIPYCFDNFKDAEHYCPNCNTFIGKTTKC